MSELRFIPLPTDDVRRLQAGGADANGQPAERRISDGGHIPCRHCLTEVAAGPTVSGRRVPPVRIAAAVRGVRADLPARRALRTLCRRGGAAADVPQLAAPADPRLRRRRPHRLRHRRPRRCRRTGRGRRRDPRPRRRRLRARPLGAVQLLPVPHRARDVKPRDLVDLVLLAAIWGASFLFMRIAAPAFGPVPLVELRVAIAAAFLLPLLVARGGLPELRANALRVGAIGVVNSAIPFALFTYATLSITAGFASILNATVPIWTAAIGALWLRQRIAGLQWLGLALGVAGVAVLVWGRVDLNPGSSQWAVTLAVAAALAACFAYGAAAHLARRIQAGVAPLVTAAGSQLGAAIVLAAPAAWLWQPQVPPASLWLAALLLGVVCTGVAYLLYFRLIARTGAVNAASVTFLIPLFGTLWGALLLGEEVTAQMVVGGAIVLAGTTMALGMFAAPARR
ncbi:MAG: DMT family transporter [Comamonadaceae bacterium]|nr:DMT family transporter [Comamonadaceae bacterium]